ncbi:1-aminocyclopropane-1-carboxylate deaminase/D-cysteine desulfhydrase [Endozoicomonas arenosclerae]|uniref:1-aminocyclopropane-1-carboxylate deaminase/D-cysteine desulfhydrase n=1 Tax=Endozoicomonas arenosclerae TaxID=1633495 RepID=UPI000783B29F|nr:pyridoxal-phosphate dependent enzyme [Endozoicomonas arenosclerae]
MYFSDVIGNKVPVERINPSFIRRSPIALDVLRLDQLHKVISGNKWFKLKCHLKEAQCRGINTLLSFGGVWSNHLHAMAAAGHLLGFKTIGIVRGEKPVNPSAMLQDAESWGMKLVYVSRSEYRQRYQPEFHRILLNQLSLSSEQVLVIPEGGSGELGVKGCEDILSAGSVVLADYDEIWMACGTGATLAGVIRSTQGAAWVRGFPVLKGVDFLNADIRQYLEPSDDRWSLELNHHCGGYGKTTPELIQFIKEFERETGVPLDPVYTGKLLLALKHKVESGDMPQPMRLLLVHTGGLQGRRGFSEWNSD